MFSVDRIENDIVILQNIKSGKIIQINISEFNYKVKEKDILVYDGFNYILNDDAKKERIRLLKERMKELRK